MPKFISSKHHVNKKKLQSPYLEKHLQGKLGRWYKKVRIERGIEWDRLKGSLCEVKLVTGGTLAFSKFEDQQLPSLKEAHELSLYHKMTDASIGAKPGDFFIADDGWIFCQFWKKKQQEVCYYLHISEAMIIKNSGAKSIKEEQFAKFGTKINLSDYK